MHVDLNILVYKYVSSLVQLYDYHLFRYQMKKKDKTLLKIIESPHVSQFYNGFVWNIKNMVLLELKGVQKVKEHRYVYFKELLAQR